MNEHLKRFLLAAAIFAVSALLFAFVRSQKEGYGLLDLWRGRGPGNPGFTMPVASRLNDGDLELTSQLNEEYSRLAAAVLPAVVSIDTTVVRRQRVQIPLVGFDAYQDYLAPGKGSGAIISREGHVVTNFHVIEGASQVIVTLSTEETFPARVLDGSRELDIALLKIDSKGKDFPALTFGDSNKVRAGQIVFAVGNPFGLSGTITQGIISASKRRFNDAGIDFLQTDTAINRGSSGGPLLDVNGDIVGINVALYKGSAENDAWQGVGLAIRANDVKLVIDTIMADPANKNSNNNPGYLGLGLFGDPVLIPAGEGQGTVGVQVREVEPASPADLAGLRTGDIITSFNGEVVDDPTDLLARIKAEGAGNKVRLTVWRDGELGYVTSELNELKTQKPEK